MLKSTTTKTKSTMTDIEKRQEAIAVFDGWERKADGMLHKEGNLSRWSFEYNDPLNHFYDLYKVCQKIRSTFFNTDLVGLIPEDVSALLIISGEMMSALGNAKPVNTIFIIVSNYCIEFLKLKGESK